jgi:hypothetical protein
MRKNQVEARQLAPGELCVLLTRSRDLFQTDETSGALELIGQTLRAMIRPDSALLLLRGDRLNIVGFDNHGVPHPAGMDHPLYRTGMPCCPIREALRTNNFMSISRSNTTGQPRSPCKIEAHRSLEQLVCDQREEMANTSVTHAAELTRRDEAATEMRMLSLTDVLTGLYNRRGFFLQAEQIYKLARRKRTQSAAIFADVDGLKQVNDKLGHDASG